MGKAFMVLLVILLVVCVVSFGLAATWIQVREEQGDA